MNQAIKQQILNKIKEYDRIILTRHFRPDGDAIGSTKGLQRILQLTFPTKEIYLINDDFSDYLAFLGGETDPIPDEEYKNALGIVLDTGTIDRISNKRITLCKELIKIDHHIDIAPYGDISLVEDWRSSTCELIVDFYKTFADELKLDTEAATYLYCGMVTDTGRFRFREVSAETLINASILLQKNIDTETLYANLYLEDYDYIKFKAKMIDEVKITKSGVAYIYITEQMQKDYGLSREDASAIVSLMDSIKGSLIWIAFIDSGDGSTRVRLRSRFLGINKLGEKYHGGGHECAAGATVYSTEEMQNLIDDAEDMLFDYKANNKGWL